MTDDFIPAWLDQVAANRGVLACAVLAADQTVTAKSCDRNYTEGQVREMIEALPETLQALKAEQITVREFCWSFEHGRLYCATRTDGAIAALVVSKKGGVPRSDIEWLLQQFMEAP